MEPSAMQASGSVRVARGVDQRSAVELRGNRDVERESLGRNHDRLSPGDAAVERAVEGNGVRGEVVPRHEDLAIRTDEGDGANGASLSARVVHPSNGERCAVIGGPGETNASSGGSAGCGVPRNVDRVAEGARGIR